MNDEIIMIPIDQIRILNPRHRDRKKFELIVQSIKNLGLKKPIQVSLRDESEPEGVGYDLICGQGRIEGCIFLGYKKIPAIVVKITKEERLLRSLVENIARRYPAPMDLIREIERLKALGYKNPEISAKLDINEGMVTGLRALKKAGEERLLEAAITGRVPLWIAIDIARSDTVETQRELLKAYESKQLNFHAIRTVKRLIEQRRFFGKDRKSVGRNPRKSRTTAEGMVNAYKRESQRQKLIIRKAKICDAKLVFVVSALDRLLADDNFVTLLRAESLDSMPKYLHSKLPLKNQEAN